jgi:hypothetical protein
MINTKSKRKKGDRRVEKEWLASRAYELGTFSGKMLPKNFKEQSKK